jgi:hypothetical protein
MLTIVSCKSALFDYALEKKGIYDEKVKIVSFKSDDKEVLFIPMVHIGTEAFYNDVKIKIDSLKKLNYFFYFELVKANVSNDTLLRKSVKLTKIPIQKEGYKPTIDSIFKAKNIKLKKEIISQPSYEIFGLDDVNSKNVDLSLEEMINYYEKNYHKIKLESCDFENSIYETPKCPLKITKEVKNDVMVNSRNNKVLNELSKESKSKIVIIYGKNHLDGIKKGMLTSGFIEVNSVVK